MGSRTHQERPLDAIRKDATRVTKLSDRSENYFTGKT